jgi:hypothetical protein
VSACEPRNLSEFIYFSKGLLFRSMAIKNITRPCLHYIHFTPFELRAKKNTIIANNHVQGCKRRIHESRGNMKAKLTKWWVSERKINESDTEWRAEQRQDQMTELEGTRNFEQ